MLIFYEVYKMHNEAITYTWNVNNVFPILFKKVFDFEQIHKSIPMH